MASNSNRLYRFLNALSRCRFNIYILIAALVLFCLLPQGADALNSLQFYGAIGFFILANAWALLLWYVARRMLSVKVSKRDTYVLDQGGLGPTETVVKWVPRMFTLSAFSILFAAFWLVDRPELSWVALTFCALCLIVPYLVEKTSQLRQQDSTEFYSVHRSQIVSVSEFFRADRHAGWLVWLLFFYAIYILGIGVWLKLFPITVAINGSHVLLIHLSMYTFVGALGFLAGMKSRVPMTLIFTTLWFVSSYFNDNHELRSYPADSTPTQLDIPRQSIRDYTDQWRAAKQTAASGKRQPLVIILAEGGGIRAAYWAAAVLENIAGDPECETLLNHVYAYSGVSGGSVGVSAFLAHQASQTKLPSTEFLKCDFLTRGLAGLLGGDMLQSFIPVPISWLDRAKSFEHSLDVAWKLKMEDDAMSSSFLDLWRNEALHPLLLLNSTELESGQRVVFSPARLEDSQGQSILVDGIDFFASYADRYGGTPLSTAAHCSSRFPYFSPPGLVETKPDAELQTKWVHLLDGGYFDNSGAITALDILNFLRADQDLLHQYQPIVIALNNSARTTSASNRPGKPDDSWFPSAEEISTPPLGIYAAWDRHTNYALKRLKQEVERDGQYFEVSLLTSQNQLPDQDANDLKFVLGWSLSEKQTQVLDDCAKLAVRQLCQDLGLAGTEKQKD